MRFSTHNPAKLGEKLSMNQSFGKDRGDDAQRPKESELIMSKVPNEAPFTAQRSTCKRWSVIGREFSIATNQVDSRKRAV